MKLSVFIPCVPPKTTAQQKGAFVVGGKVRFFTKKEVAQAGNDLCSLLAPYRPVTPFDGPVTVDVVLCFPWRKNVTKKAMALGAAPIDTRPDVDNMTKMFMDALTRTAFWADDGLVSDLRVRKAWCNKIGIALRIESIDTLLDGWVASLLADLETASTPLAPSGHPLVKLEDGEQPLPSFEDLFT